MSRHDIEELVREYPSVGIRLLDAVSRKVRGLEAYRDYRWTSPERLRRFRSPPRLSAAKAPLAGPAKAGFTLPTSQ